MKPHLTRFQRIALAMLAMLTLGGCSTSMFIHGAYQPVPDGGIDLGPYDKTPKPRVGSLPWPGMFTLFELGDAEALGHHAYDGRGDEAECVRGILYTKRGGFIDIAHVRKTADLCKYAAVRIEIALLNDWSAVRLKSREPSIYDVHLHYPSDWHTLSPNEKQRIAKELSIRMGQRIGMLMITWHEVLTWFGYQATVVLPERQSAFTYDDSGSHALGVLVAGRALRDESRDYDAAVTLAIDEALRELGAVTPEQTMQAVEKVKGVWWNGFQPLKRQFDTGLDGGAIEAWIVPGLPFAPDAQPHRYTLPRLDNVYGRDFSDLYRVAIQPNVWQTGAIRKVIPDKPRIIDAAEHLPIIIDHMKQWHVEREGEAVLHR